MPRIAGSVYRLILKEAGWLIGKKTLSDWSRTMDSLAGFQVTTEAGRKTQDDSKMGD